MDAWTGRETAGIVYDDKNSVLTEPLIDKGYLVQDQWRDLEPSYYIGVKATTGARDMPFYMSIVLESKFCRVTHLCHANIVFQVEIYPIEHLAR